MMNRKGISEIIATVLIVLIVVAAFVIVWQVVLPLVTEKSTEGQDCLTAVQQVTITGACLTSDNEIQFLVSHGNKDVGLDEITVIPYDADGNTGAKETISTALLKPNEEATLKTDVIDNTPERVAFALVVGGKECTASTPKLLTNC